MFAAHKPKPTSTIGVSGRGQQALLDQPAKAPSSHIGAATTATDLKEQLTVLRF